MTRRLALSAAVTLAVLGAPPAASADEATDTAREHFTRAEKLFGLGRFAEARVEYEAAYEAKPLPEFLYNIGQCHRNLGDFESAIFSFRRYLDLKPDAANRNAVETLIADLQAELAAADRKRPLVPPSGPPGGGEPRDDRARPIYKKWWFWTGVVAVAAAGTGATVALTRGGSDAIPSSDLGNVDFSR